jgi:hypothetical protein
MKRVMFSHWLGNFPAAFQSFGKNHIITSGKPDGFKFTAYFNFSL